MPKTTFDVKFEDLIFRRSNDDLIISYEDASGYNQETYSEFFTTETPIETIKTLDTTGSSVYTEHNLKEDAYIEVEVTTGSYGYMATDYNEVITVSANNTVSLNTKGGNDTINHTGAGTLSAQGEAGNDTYYSGSGTDTFIGGLGADTYVFKANDGNDGIQSYTANDIIKFTNVDWEDLNFARTDKNLYITYGNASVTITNFFNSDGSISDGAFDTIYSSESTEPHSISEECDFPVTYFTNRAFSDLKFVRENDDLIIYGALDEQKLTTYANFFTTSPIETVTALGSDGNYKSFDIKTDAQINVTVDDETLEFAGTDYNEIIKSGAVTEQISAGKGNDTIYAGDSGERFVFKSGDGKDVVINGTSADSLLFTNVAYNKLVFSQYGNDMIIEYDDDMITIKNAFDNDGNLLETGINTIYTTDSEDPHYISGDIDFSRTEFNIAFSDLDFSRSVDNLVIKDKTTYKVMTVYKDFFNSSEPIDIITALDENGDVREYSIKTDAQINVIVNDVTEEYTGTDYNEIITGGELVTFISGGAGNDVIDARESTAQNVQLIGGVGNDSLTSNINNTDGDVTTFVFYSGDGDDVIKSSNADDIINFYDANFEELEFSKSDCDLIIDYGTDSVTVKNYYNEAGEVADNVVDIIRCGDDENYSISNNVLPYVDNCYDVSDFSKGAFKNLSGESLKIVASDYISTTSKGVTITTGLGDDYIVGSLTNDTITSKGGSNTISEYGGVNKITTKDGNDSISLYGYSSNTVDAGKGINTINIESTGKNNIKTSGNYADKITISAGVNTVSAANGENVFNIYDGINTLKAGSNDDTCNIYGGNNTVKLGAGNDEFLIDSMLDVNNNSFDGGLNNITVGKGDHSFIINAGINTIKTTKAIQKDTYEITSGYNNITAGAISKYTISGGVNIINGSKSTDEYIINDGKIFITDKGGSDNYNLFNADYDSVFVTINDTKGTNVINFNEDIKDKNVFFDVTVGKKSKDENYKYTLGKTVAFTTLDNSGVYDTGFEMTLDKNKQIGTICISNNGVVETADKYSLSLNEVAQNVANWLGASGTYKSATEVFDKGVEDDVNAILALYTTVDESIKAI